MAQRPSPLKEYATALKLLNRWWTLYKAGRVRPDPDVIKLATETDAYINPVPPPPRSEPEREGNA